MVFVAGAVVSVVSTLMLATAGTASADDQPQTNNISLGPSESKNVQFMCPPAAPYLVNKRYVTGRMAPNGVEVIEDGGVGVSMQNDGLSREWEAQQAEPITVGGRPWVKLPNRGARGSATNWNTFPREVNIILHCTSNKAETYFDERPAKAFG